MTDSAATPKLKKSRIRHTRYAAILLVGLILFSIGSISEEGFVHAIAEWLGYILVIICVLGRSYCSLFIGGRKNDVVVDIGPYSVVRNPLYVFSFLGVLGIGLQSGIYSVAIALVLIFLLYYRSVINREEEFLAHKFADQYKHYKSNVPKWIPKLSLWRAPEYIETKPGFVLKTMKDASMFFIAFPFFELLEILHETGSLPAFLTIF